MTKQHPLPGAVRTKFIVLAVAIGALAASAFAEVADSSSNGFTTRIVLTIQAPPADVYSRLVHNVGDWWSSAHSFSGDAHNLSIEERPMGCFCEKLANHGGVRHMEVVFVSPGKMLRMSGALGPLQGLASSGAMTFNLSPADGGTKLEFTYAVAGYAAQGMSPWAAPVDAMLTEQMTRLKNYVETGNPAGAAAPQRK